MIPCVAKLPPDLTWKEKLAYLTYKFLDETQIDCPLEHIFEEGKYIREIKIPKGTLFIGRVHRHGHLCQLLDGEIVHITEAGSKRLTAPFELHTTPDYQMVLYTLTDVLGRSVHPNREESRDVPALEADAFESVESLKALGREVETRLKERLWQESAQPLVPSAPLAAG